MKKIAYVLPSFPVVSETFITTEMHAMQRRGHELVPVCFFSEEGACQPGDENILQDMRLLSDVEPWTLLSLLREIGGGLILAMEFCSLQKGIPFKSLLYQGLKLAFIAKSTGCSHIHAHFAQGTAATAIVAARFLGISVSFTGHGHDIYSFPEDLHIKLQYADLTIAVCNRMHNYLRDFPKSNNVKLVYCGVNTDFWTKGNIQPKNKLLFVGRLSAIKGIDDLIRAIAAIPEVNRPLLDIAGEGELKEDLKGLVQKYELNRWIRFLGAVNREWIKSASADYKGMVLPFCRGKDGGYDTGPIVLKEAMSLEVLLVTSDLIATGEFIDDKACLVHREGDVKDLTQKIVTLLNLTSSESKRLTLKARERVVKKFSDVTQARLMSNYIESL